LPNAPTIRSPTKNPSAQTGTIFQRFVLSELEHLGDDELADFRLVDWLNDADHSLGWDVPGGQAEAKVVTIEVPNGRLLAVGHLIQRIRRVVRRDSHGITGSDRKMWFGAVQSWESLHSSKHTDQ